MTVCVYISDIIQLLKGKCSLDMCRYMIICYFSYINTFIIEYEKCLKHLLKNDTLVIRNFDVTGKL